MDIILTLEKFPRLSKLAINQGNLPNSSILISDFLRSTYLLSNTLLHDNNLIIFCSNHFFSQPKGLLVFFYGKQLRYLAPDERGIEFLLLKICKIITGEGGKKQEMRESEKFRQFFKAQSTPGIYLKRGNFKDIWDMFSPRSNAFYIIGKNAQAYPIINSFEELEEKVDTKSTLVFLLDEQSEFTPPNSNINIFHFIDNTWKDKFYHSELISYIQAKITQ
jgi:hypothetical protein